MKRFAALFISILLLVFLACVPTSWGDSVNTYTVNTTPDPSADYLLGINDYAGTWSVNRFGIPALIALANPVDTGDENATFYPLLVDGATGTQAIETDGEFTYNPNTGMLTAPGFTGPLTGQASTAAAVAIGGITGLGTGVATALAVNVGSAGAPVVLNGALGTPSSGTLTNATGLPIGGTTGWGTGVATALAVNVGSAGAPVVLNGALGTPSSGTLTNATGLPVASGVSGFGSNVATFLATPTTANLAAAVTGETGTGAVVFGTSPTIATPVMTMDNVTDATDSIAVTAPQVSSTQITNQGWDATDDQVWTLPDISSNDGSVVYKFTLINVETPSTGDIRITPDGSSEIFLNGDPGGNGDYVYNLLPDIADGITCQSVSLDGSSSNWFCYTVQGAWLPE